MSVIIILLNLVHFLNSGEYVVTNKMAEKPRGILKLFKKLQIRKNRQQNCPKCSSPAEIDSDSFFGSCNSCEYYFCTQCKEAYHGFECSTVITPPENSSTSQNDPDSEPLESDEDVEEMFQKIDRQSQGADEQDDDEWQHAILNLLLNKNHSLPPIRNDANCAGASAETSKNKNNTQSAESVTCAICLTEVHSIQIVDLGCSHKTSCQSCTKDYFETQITTGEIHGLKCAEPKCGFEAPLPIIKKLVKQELFEKLEDLLLTEALSAFPEIVNCPNHHCQQRVVAEPEYGYCDLCEYRFCTECNQAFHGAAPCGMTDIEMKTQMRRYAIADEAERARLDQETKSQRKVENEASEMLIKNIFKKCPTCNASVEKISGCNAMTCTKCQKNFCWLCLGIIQSKDPHDHFQSSNCQLFEIPPE